MTLVDRPARDRGTDWSSCWTGQALRGSGCPRCGCCCCAAGEGTAPAARQGPPATTESSRGKRQRRSPNTGDSDRQTPTFSSSFSPLSLMKTFSSSWLMPSMLLGTLEMEGFGTVMLDSGIWADFDMENCCNGNKTIPKRSKRR